jgi:hypothetical protein
MRSVLAVIVGLFVFFIVVMTWQGGVMAAVYPLPEWVDPNDMESVKAGILVMPAAAHGLLLVGYALATACAGAVAAAVADRRRMTCAAIVGGLATLGGILNFVALPHPTWVVVVGLPMYMVMALIGGRLGLRLTRS